MAENYSPQMEAAVRHQVQQASSERLTQLLGYFRQRGGPGLGLVETEVAERAQRLAACSP